MPKAISYIRFSSKIQASGDSTKRQNKYINEWLKNNPDYHLDESLRFQDLGISGYSGANAKSGAFGEFLAAVESGAIQAGSVLLVESLDRVSRQDIDTARERLRKILLAGVDVVTLADNSWYKKESLNDPLSLIKAVLIMQRANEESATKSKRLRSAWDAKREDAAKGKIMSRRCVAWLRVSGDMSHFELIPDNVKAVQRVFQLRLEGLPFVRIARQMNEEGFYTLNQRNPVKGAWSHTTVKALLDNRSVIGFKVPSNCTVTQGVKEIPNYYPAVISEEQFYAVQQLKQGAGRRPSSEKPLLTNLFKGVMRCGECGFVTVVNCATEKWHGVYRCSMRYEGRCDAKSINRRLADKSLVQGLLYNTNRLYLNRDNGSAIGSLQTELEQLQKQRERLIKLAMLADDTESMAKDLKALNSQIKDAEKVVSEVHQREQSSQLETISHLDLTVKKDRIEAQIIIKRIVKEIRLNTAGKKCDVFLHNGLKLYNFPLDRVVDGAQWLEILPLIDGDEFDFEGLTTKPRHIALEEAPEWVKEMEEQPNQPL
ncbi:Resolvase, N terminal domain [Serratia fonticola]|uniref:recombinase family protein n=1 Tax=Serratia fonticola TaxID=47917 RepID=UPI00217967AD|nr:recombinase family protein [Serratia fonticola]CAI1046459.1 Resolvase, N terminal domain [Serratia fonticola]